MTAPTITFYTSSATPTGNTPDTCFNMYELGQMATVFDYGTIDTGSSGSNTWFWIWNNIAGAASIADAVLSSSGQTWAAAAQLGLGHHESGSAGHASESSYSWGLQSGSLTGSVNVISNYYLQSGAGDKFTSGALAGSWTAIYSGSSGTRMTITGLKLSGSSSLGGGSGSAWLVGSYIYANNALTQGSKTGSFCLKYTYT